MGGGAVVDGGAEQEGQRADHRAPRVGAISRN